MHVPKTSGISLNTGLIEALRPRRPVTGFDRMLFGAFSDYDSFSPAVRRAIVDHPGRLPASGTFVHGHYALSTTVRAYPAAQFITVLREPAARLLSLWRYWRTQTAATMAGWGSWTGVVERSRQPFERFLADRAIPQQTDNVALRMLLWPHRLIDDAAFIDPRHDEALLAEAQRRLERFGFLDVVENPGLESRLGVWLRRPFRYPMLNRTVPRSGDEALSADELTRSLALIEARSRLDRALWEPLVALRLPGEDVAALRERVMLQAVGRHAAAA